MSRHAREDSERPRLIEGEPSRLRRCWFPRFETPIKTLRSPLENCRGTRPTQAARSRPFLNSEPSPIAATTAVAVLGADAFDLRNGQAGIVVAENLFDFLVEGGDPSIEVPEEIIEFGDGVARHRCQLIVLIGQDLGNCAPRPGNAFGKGESTIEQEAADLTDDRRAVIDHPLPRPMQGLDILLFDGRGQHDHERGEHVALPGMASYRARSMIGIGRSSFSITVISSKALVL